MTESVRLAKSLAESITCSRREAESYIEGGWVLVDGIVVEEPGFRLAPGQLVTLSPEATLAPITPVTILFHKPAGVEALSDLSPLLPLLAPASRAADDRSGQHILKRHLANLTLATPLGKVASGLIVLTQDFRIVRKLVDDAVRIEHEYVVDVAGAIAADGLARLNEGIPLPGRPPGPVKVSWQNETRHITVMCEAVGLQAQAIRRIRIGRMAMAGLAVGQWRYLIGYERF